MTDADCCKIEHFQMQHILTLAAANMRESIGRIEKFMYTKATTEGSFKLIRQVFVFIYHV